MTAETEAEVEWQFASRALWRLSRDKGVYQALPSPEEAAAHQYADIDQVRLAAIRSRALAGTPHQVLARMKALSTSLGVDEIVVLTTLHDPAVRRDSYTLLAEAAGLTTILPNASSGALMAAE